jgi:antitoxin (DNA-binding transcriptional repressor) of toxin-antitoxin stability system
MNKSVTERIDLAVLVTNPAEYLSRVQLEGLTYEITRNGKVVAQLMPPKTPLTLAELDKVFEGVPPMPVEEAALWEAELEALRRDMPIPESPWES